MKWLLMLIGIVAISMLIWFLFLAHQSKNVPKLGLVNGQLATCRQGSNCVNSADAASGIAAISFKGTAAEGWADMHKTLMVVDGAVQQHTDNYLWATFTTPLFGYVDDVELLMEPDQQRFQIRSASRVGRSDFGANRDRVAAIRGRFSETASGSGR